MWTVGPSVVSDRGCVTGYVVGDSGEMVARLVHHVDNVVPIWQSDKARRINRIVSGSGRDAFMAWCGDIADGFAEWAEQRDAGDPVSFAAYCEDLLYWEDRTGWIQDYLASYFDTLPPRCHAVIVAEIRHAVSEMGAGVTA